MANFLATLTETTPPLPLVSGVDALVIDVDGGQVFNVYEDASLEVRSSAGANTFNLQGSAADYRISHIGTGGKVVISQVDGAAQISFDVRPLAQTLVFADGAVDLYIDADDGMIALGNQDITVAQGAAIVATLDYSETSRDDFDTNTVEGQVFTLTEIAPEIDKTFVWEGVETEGSFLSNIEDLLGYDADCCCCFDESYLNFMAGIIGSYDALVDEEVIYAFPELTPESQNEGVIEERMDGYALEGDDVIIAGRASALHGAYLDAGEGYDILKVDMKGIFAQPTQLLNIEEIQVQNLRNYYGDELYPGYSNEMPNGAGRYYDEFWHFDLNNAGRSVLDVSRADSLERIVVTEGDSNGDLTVVGIKNGADARLEGSFSHSVVLHYTTGQDAGSLKLELVNVHALNEDLNGLTHNLLIAHDYRTLELDSKGQQNVLHSANLGGYLDELTIGGGARLVIEEALDFPHYNTAHIDASANYGGVELTVDGEEDVEFIGSTAADKFTVDNGSNVTILGGMDHSEYLIAGADMSITDLGGYDAFRVTGTAAPNGNNPANQAVLGIDGGAGRDLLQLGIDGGDEDRAGIDDAYVGLDALEGSYIAGEFHLHVKEASNLTRADLVNDDGSSAIVSVALADQLTIGQDQFALIGVEAFRGHNGRVGELYVEITEDARLDELVDIESLPADVDLYLNIYPGATLTITAEQLHKYVVEDGIDGRFLGADGNPVPAHGNLRIVDAAVGFKASDIGDYQDGGTIANFDYGLVVVRTANGFDRPDFSGSSDTLVIDTNALEIDLDAGRVIVNDRIVSEDDPATTLTNLVIVGDEPLTITRPVNLADNFTVDFSELTADLAITLADFQDITAAANVKDQGWIRGNDLPNRIDVELAAGESVGAKGNENGLKSTGVETYVVTELEGGASNFYVCDNTQGVETLGLQGNWDGAISFLQVKWGTEFLLEGDGYANWNELPKVDFDPNASNIGTFQAEFFWPGAPAVVHINNQGTALGMTSTGGDRPLEVAGITVNNAVSLAIHVQDGDAILNDLHGDGVETLTLTSADDVTVRGDLAFGANGDALASLDASAVDGLFSIELTQDTLTDLSDVELAGVDRIVFANKGANNALTLTVDQALALGLDSLVTADSTNNSSTLNLNNLSTQVLDLSDVDVPNIGTITIADVDGTVVLDPATHLGGADKIVIQAKTSDTTLEMTADQYLQVCNNVDPALGNEARVCGNGDPYDATLVITDPADDVELDLGHIAPEIHQVLRISDFAASEGANIDNANGLTVQVAGGDNDLTELTPVDAISQVEFTAEGSLTLTAAQVAAIGTADADGDGVADAWAGMDGATLHIVDLNDQALDLDAVREAGINIGTVSIDNANVNVTLHADTTLGGADEIVTPSWGNDDANAGIEDTQLTLTAAQFNGSAGVIVGDGRVHITALANNTDTDGDFELDAAAIDVSAVAAPRATITLGEATVTLADDADIGGFEIRLDSGQLIRFANETQASAEITVIQGATPTAVQWTWTTFGTEVDTADYDRDITTLYIDEALLVSQDREEDLWTTLSGDIEVEKLNGSTIPELFKADRVNTFEALTNISDGINYDDDAEFSTVSKLTMNLEGEVYLGDILLGDTNNGDGTTPNLDGRGFFQTLVINSYLDLTTVEGYNPAANIVPGRVIEQNTIGDIRLNADSLDELVNVAIHTYADADNDLATDDGGFYDAENVNGAAAERDGLAIKVGTIEFAAHAAKMAMLTLTGAEDIAIGGVDIADDQVNWLTIDATGHIGDLTIGGIAPVDGINDFGYIHVFDGYAAKPGDALGDAAAADLLAIAGGDNDLTEATLDIQEVYFAADATLTLTAAQVAAIGIVDINQDCIADNWSVAAGAGATLHIVDLYDGVDLDLKWIEDAGINIGVVSTQVDADVTLDETMTLGGADEVRVLLKDANATLTLTAEQFQQIDGGDITEHEDTSPSACVDDSCPAEEANNRASVVIDKLEGIECPAVTIDLANVTTTGDNRLFISDSVTGAQVDGGNGDVELTADSDLGSFAVVLWDENSGPAPDQMSGENIRFATAEQAEREVRIMDAELALAEHDTNVVWLFNVITGTATPGKVDTSGYDADLGRLWMNDRLVEGENVEELYTTLASSIIVRVVNTDDLDEILSTTGYDRTVEVESFTVLSNDGLEFTDEDLLEHVQTLTIELGGSTSIGDLTLDNILSTERLENDDEFRLLTIFSLLPTAGDSTYHYLLPEGFDPNLPYPVNPWPNGANVVGDISAGDERDQLHTIELKATGVDLKVGTLYYAAPTPAANENAVTATLTLSGAHDVIMEGIDTADDDEDEMAGLRIREGGFTGDLTVAGSINLGNGTFLYAADIDTALMLGTLEAVNSTNFRFTSGSGYTELALDDDMDLDIRPDPRDDDYDTYEGWTFDFSNAGRSDAGQKSILSLRGATVGSAENSIRGLTIDLNNHSTLRIRETLELIGGDNIDGGEVDLLPAAKLILTTTTVPDGLLSFANAERYNETTGEFEGYGNIQVLGHEVGGVGVVANRAGVVAANQDLRFGFNVILPDVDGPNEDDLDEDTLVAYFAAQGIAFAAEDNVVLVAASDGKDTVVYVAVNRDNDLAVDDDELFEAVRFNGVTTTAAIDLDELPDFDEVFPVVSANQIFGVDEDSPAGTLVDVVQASSDAVDFDIIGSSLFEIDYKGRITVTDEGAGALDFHAVSGYTLEIRATDEANNRSDSRVVTIVSDEAPIIAANQTFSITENSLANTPVGAGAVQATDNVGVVSFAIRSGNDNGFFAIDENGQIRITEAGAAGIDYETLTQHTLGVVARDGDGYDSLVTNVRVNVEDVDDEAPVINSNQVLSVAENSPAEVFGRVAATDNVGIEAFTITTGNEDDFFAINDAGQLRLTAAGAAGIDFETTPSYTLGIIARDAAGNVTEAAVDVRVNVDDVDEVAPTIAPGQTFSITENSPAETLVNGGVVAADDNVGVVAFTIVSGNVGGLFAIASDGQLSITAAGIDFETTPSYTLGIIARDAAGNVTEAAVDVRVNVDDVDEVAPTLEITTPVDDALDVPVDADLVLDFDEPVVAGTGNIIITDGVTPITIPVNDPQVTIVDDIVTINPTADLLPGTEYDVNIAPAAFEDLAGNDFVPTNPVIEFTTAAGGDVTAPTLQATTPVDDAVDIAVDANLVLDFDEPVQAGTGNIIITDGVTPITIPVNDPQVTIVDDIVTINPTADLLPGTEYDVNIAPAAFEDLAGNDFVPTNPVIEFTTEAGGVVELDLDGLGGDAQNRVARTLEDGAVTVIDDVATSSNTAVTGFGVDDVLQLVGVTANDVRVAVGDGNTEINFDDGAGNTSEIVLLGVNGFWTNVDEFNLSNDGIAGDITFA